MNEYEWQELDVKSTVLHPIESSQGGAYPSGFRASGESCDLFSFRSPLRLILEELRLNELALQDGSAGCLGCQDIHESARRVWSLRSWFLGGMPYSQHLGSILGGSKPFG